MTHMYKYTRKYVNCDADNAAMYTLGNNKYIQGLSLIYSKVSI